MCAQRLPLQSPHLVVIDGDAPLLAALAFSLETEGYRVSAFERADALLRDRKAMMQADCFVIDQALTPRSGLMLLSELRRRQALAPAVLLTGRADAAIRRAAGERQAVVVEKPLLTDALSRQISGLLAAR